MATSRCAKCEGTSFEAVRADLKGTRFGYMLVQCAGCGTVVGVMDAYNVPNLLFNAARKLGVNLR